MWWNSKKYNSICPITRTRLRHGKNRYGLTYSVFLKCKHGFNRNGLVTWVLKKPKQNPTCPLCRVEFDSLIAFI
jgi:hypothetical protein